VLRTSARAGLVARAALYLVLAYLAASVALGSGTGDHQVNANGAMRTVAATQIGWVALAAAAVGFAAFSLIRFAAAIGDHRVSRRRRVTTAGQATFYAVMATVTARFLLGSRSTGSEQQQRSTVDRLVTSPEGRAALVVVGTTVLVVGGWQVYLSLRGGFADSLELSEVPLRHRRTVRLFGAAAIAARACCVAPLGLLLVLAGVSDQAARAPGLDRAVATLAELPVGRALVVVIAVGFALFALYSLIEARYRVVHAGD
jgi:hypothetical protein